MIRSSFIVALVACIGSAQPLSAQNVRDAKLDSFLKMDNSGISATYCNLDTVLNTVDLTLDFHFSDKALKILTKDILGDSTQLSIDDAPIDCDREAKFTFKKVYLVLDTARNAYVSKGPLPLAKINDQVINKELAGFIVFQMKKGGNEVNLYFDHPSGNYYHFQYYRGLMQVWSKNEPFNDKVKNTVDRKRKYKGIGIGNHYQFIIGSRARLTKVLASYAEITMGD